MIVLVFDLWQVFDFTSILGVYVGHTDPLALPTRPGWVFMCSTEMYVLQDYVWGM